MNNSHFVMAMVALWVGMIAFVEASSVPKLPLKLQTSFAAFRTIRDASLLGNALLGLGPFA